MSLGEKLKQLRLQNGLSQEQLSIKLSIATRTYIYYEKGEKYPSVELLVKMAQFFKVGICFLVDEQNEKEQWCKCNKLDAKQLVNEISSLFSGGELSEADKDVVMEAVQEAYWAAKKQN